MFRGSLSKPRRLARPAPPGARPASDVTGPPDGWRRLGVGPLRRAEFTADSTLLLATDSIVRRMSRRRFLRGAGELGLVIGVGASKLLFDAPAWAAPELECNCFGDGESGPCGPSDLCFLSECGNNGHCDSNAVCSNGVHVKGRPHNDMDCGTSGCWNECCGGTTRLCCDCCGCRQHTIQCVSNCGATHYKCICRHKPRYKLFIDQLPIEFRGEGSIVTAVYLGGVFLAVVVGVAQYDGG